MIVLEVRNRLNKRKANVPVKATRNSSRESETLIPLQAARRQPVLRCYNSLERRCDDAGQLAG
jgi:hypothetical protein